MIKGLSRHRDIHHARIETKILARVRSDVQLRLREQPKGCEDPQKAFCRCRETAPVSRTLEPFGPPDELLMRVV
jgi:hypothetical protein